MIPKQFYELYKIIRQDIFKFCELFDFHPTEQQRQLLQAVQDGKKRIACKSGQGPGKTSATVIIGLWRAFRHVDARIIVTAPTMKQCIKAWLAEARLWVGKAHPFIRDIVRVTKSRIEIGNRPDWGINFMTSSNPEAAQGQHNDHLTFIADEASGIERPLITQIEGTLSQKSEDPLFIQIGNPNSRDCAFFDCFSSLRHYWHCLTWNAEDSPNVSREHVAYLADVYGKDSNVYKVRVLGEFPNTDPNCIVSSDEVEACFHTNIYEFARKNRFFSIEYDPVRQFGIDFARFGLDESVVYRRSGYSIIDYKLFNRVEPAHVIDATFRMQIQHGWKNADTWYIADASGMGQGVMYKFHEAGKTVFEFISNGVPFMPDFENIITEAWFDLAKLIREKKCHLPNDRELVSQLSNRQYYITKKGKICLEPKEDFAKRGYSSPDRADALAMAFYDKPCAKAGIALHGGYNKVVGIGL